MKIDKTNIARIFLKYSLVLSLQISRYMKGKVRIVWGKENIESRDVL